MCKSGWDYSPEKECYINGHYTDDQCTLGMFIPTCLLKLLVANIKRRHSRLVLNAHTDLYVYYNEILTVGLYRPCMRLGLSRLLSLG